MPGDRRPVPGHEDYSFVCCSDIDHWSAIEERPKQEALVTSSADDIIIFSRVLNWRGIGSIAHILSYHKPD
ncbi:hypothetical protein GOV10_04075, partial [Candidatus Woesearchaeota archaeon]|nr:hypothetical protein [Candidatus Woesearchaeota archaeon]